MTGIKKIKLREIEKAHSEARTVCGFPWFMYEYCDKLLKGDIKQVHVMQGNKRLYKFSDFKMKVV